MSDENNIDWKGAIPDNCNWLLFQNKKKTYTGKDNSASFIVASASTPDTTEALVTFKQVGSNKCCKIKVVRKGLSEYERDTEPEIINKHVNGVWVEPISDTLPYSGGTYEKLSGFCKNAWTEVYYYHYKGTDIKVKDENGEDKKDIVEKESEPINVTTVGKWTTNADWVTMNKGKFTYTKNDGESERAMSVKFTYLFQSGTASFKQLANSVKVTYYVYTNVQNALVDFKSGKNVLKSLRATTKCDDNSPFLNLGRSISVMESSGGTVTLSVTSQNSGKPTYVVSYQISETNKDVTAQIITQKTTGETKYDIDAKPNKWTFSDNKPLTPTVRAVKVTEIYDAANKEVTFDENRKAYVKIPSHKDVEKIDSDYKCTAPNGIIVSDNGKTLAASDSFYGDGEVKYTLNANTGKTATIKIHKEKVVKKTEYEITLGITLNEAFGYSDKPLEEDFSLIFSVNGRFYKDNGYNQKPTESATTGSTRISIFAGERSDYNENITLPYGTHVPDGYTLIWDNIVLPTEPFETDKSIFTFKHG